jgi:multiple sugar transport system ATP-binding protein
LLEAELRGNDIHFADGQSLRIAKPVIGSSAGKRVLVGIRPEDFTDASRANGKRDSQKLSMSFVVSETLGSDTFIIGDLAGVRVTARCTPGTNAKPGERMVVFADASKLHLFDPDTKKRI